MTDITFKLVTPELSNIYDADGDLVGEVFRQPDVLNPGSHYYVVVLDEDPRGFTRVHDRSRIREVALQRVTSHPYW